MFEKRYEEYVQENEDTVRDYRERGLLVEVDTGKGTEESWEKLYNGLQKDIKWMDKRKTKERSNKQEKGTLIKKAYELGEFDGMDMALIICKHGRCTTYGTPYSPSAAASVAADSVSNSSADAPIES